MKIGDDIKKLRLQLGLTQEELAERSEVTKGFISQIERNLTSPSIDSLDDILEALGTNLSDFFKHETVERIAFHRDDFYEFYDEPNRSTICWIVPNAQKNSMEPIKVRLQKEGSTKRYEPNEGEQFAYVLTGKVNVHFGDEIHSLEKGDCFYSKNHQSVQLFNHSTEACEFIWVTNPPSF